MKIRFEEKQDIPENDPVWSFKPSNYLIKHER